MAKFLNSLLSFLLIISVALAINQVNAQSRCTEILNPNGCVLYDCKKECFQKRNGNGLCSSAGLGQYVCTCVYNCSLDKLNSYN
ncbi:defensin-like protein [Capsicum chacoense]